MKALKIILGILLIIGALSSLMSFFKQITSYEASETIGHLIAIALISWAAYALLKPSKSN
ncbi:MAG: hypothetical protein ACOYBS_02855 [Flavobacterium sp.]